MCQPVVDTACLDKWTFPYKFSQEYLNIIGGKLYHPFKK